MRINPISILEWSAWAFMAVFCVFIIVICISAIFGLMQFGVNGI